MFHSSLNGRAVESKKDYTMPGLDDHRMPNRWMSGRSCWSGTPPFAEGRRGADLAVNGAGSGHDAIDALTRDSKNEVERREGERRMSGCWPDRRIIRGSSTPNYGVTDIVVY
jgi:hypothetical protein